MDKITPQKKAVGTSLKEAQADNSQGTNKVREIKPKFNDFIVFRVD